MGLKKKSIALGLALIVGLSVSACEAYQTPVGSMVSIDGSTQAKLSLTSENIPQALQGVGITSGEISPETSVKKKEEKAGEKEESKEEKTEGKETEKPSLAPNTTQDIKTKEQSEKESNATAVVKAENLISGATNIKSLSDPQLAGVCTALAKKASAEFVQVSSEGCDFTFDVPEMKPDEKGKIDLDAYLGEIFTSLTESKADEMDTYTKVAKARQHVFFPPQNSKDVMEVTITGDFQEVSDTIKKHATTVKDNQIVLPLILADTLPEGASELKDLYVSVKQEAPETPTPKVTAKPTPKPAQPAQTAKSGIPTWALGVGGGALIILLGSAYYLVNRKKEYDQTLVTYPQATPQQYAQPTIQDGTAGYTQAPQSQDWGRQNLGSGLNDWG